MPYRQLYYHLVWSTKYREPVLTPDVERMMYRFIRKKTAQVGGRIRALNGWVDHVHLVVEIPSTIGVSEFVRLIKGYSTSQFNRSGHPAAPIYWQRSYAAFSVEKKRLAGLIAYVRNQKSHHGKRLADAKDDA